MSDIVTTIEQSRIIPVIKLENADDAIPLFEAFKAGGAKVAELTLRTDAALEAIRRVAEAMPDYLLGAGTVLTPDQVRAVKAAGARFAVSPGFNPEVVRTANEVGLPFFPGVFTPSDIENAVAMGCKVLKWFPAEPGGGMEMFKAIYAPYAHLGLKFIGLGGIGPDLVATYLAHPAIVAIGGSFLAKPEWIKNKEWDKVTETTRNAIAAS